MNRISFLFVLTAGIAAMAGCNSGGPRCEPIPTCTPACDITMGEYCSATNTCTTLPTCSPACDFAMGEYCSATNTCSPLPRVCAPTCGSGEYCDDGTCRALPVCSPACESGEVCVE